jgi:hypothetical protein
MKLVLVAACALVGACVQKGEFECATDPQCAPGVCGPRGFCAFADTSCTSGWRYGDYAAAGIAGTCTGSDADARIGPDAPPFFDGAPPADAGPLAGCVDQLAAGSGITCALRADGALVCWGVNDELELGNPQAELVSTPIVASGMGLPSGIRQVTAGDRFTCVLDDQGKVYCIGDDYYHQIGVASASSRWTQVPLLGVATKISTGEDSSCALLQDHTVACWGANDVGQLGDATANDHISPVAVSGVSGATDVATGGDHACALVAGGGVLCWGADDIGQLGDGDLAGSGSPPKAAHAAIATGAVELVSGGSHSCIRDGAGQV